VRAYRISPWDPARPASQLFAGLAATRAGQQSGRWDNSRLYGALYLSLAQAGAVAEVFGNHSVWTDALFDVPSSKLRRHLLTVEVDDAVMAGVVDIDDAALLARRGLRPSQIAGRARTATRSLAVDLFAEGATGIRFWSYYRPEWTNLVLFVPPVDASGVMVVEAEAMHLTMPCVAAASEMLCRVIEA
jgi:hypothetical protein